MLIFNSFFSILTLVDEIILLIANILTLIIVFIFLIYAN